MTSYKILKKYSIFIVLGIILLFSLFIIYLKQLNNNDNNNDNDNENKILRFVDINKAAYGKSGPPEFGASKTCKANFDIVGYCMDYDVCCSNPSEPTKCFCEHPFVKACKTSHDECMNNSANKSKYPSITDLTEKCKNDNEECCKKYNDIPIESTNFSTPPTHQTQIDNKLCSVSSYRNNETKCLELCQTNPDCAAYNTLDCGCNLFTKVSEYHPKLDTYGHPAENTGIKFYIKK